MTDTALFSAPVHRENSRLNAKIKLCLGLALVSAGLGDVAALITWPGLLALSEHSPEIKTRMAIHGPEIKPILQIILPIFWTCLCATLGGLGVAVAVMSERKPQAASAVITVIIFGMCAVYVAAFAFLLAR